MWKCENIAKALAVCMFSYLQIFVFAHPALALEVVWDDRTPQEHREWGDRNHLREHMEVAAKRICSALYGEEPRSRLHENYTVILYLSPDKGGNPAFASRRRITWKVSEHPSGDLVGCPGILVHEMTHVLDMGSDSVFTEAMADWVRYYRWDSKPSAMGKRYSALRGSRHYGKYISGANFVDFMTCNYGEGTIYRILQGYAKHHAKVWEELFGKTLDGLVQEWRQMETIYDPVFQWFFNGKPEGAWRNDKGKCPLPRLSLGEVEPKGAVLEGASFGEVPNMKEGNLTIALHGWLPKAGNVAIASLGSVKDVNGKAVLLATTSKRDALAAHVIASVPGRGRRIVSTTSIPLSPTSTQDSNSSPGSTAIALAAAVPHSFILTVKGGDAVAVIVDGKAVAKIDMKAKCDGCTFSPKFAVGGMNGGFGVAGFSESNGKAGFWLSDMRVFDRTFRPREAKSYAETFNADFRPGVAVTAEWRGPAGSVDLDNADNWFCVNAAGEKITALPTKETEVSVYGKKIPNVPRGKALQCKSFTIAGIAIVEDNIDLRGVRIVDVEDNSRIIVSKGNGMVVNALRANRIRLDGTLAVTSGLKATGNLEMKEGSVVKLPVDPNMVQVKSISIKGEGTVAIKSGETPKRGQFQKLLCIEEMPEDLSQFRLNLSDEDKDATFKSDTSGKFLGVVPQS